MTTPIRSTRYSAAYDVSEASMELLKSVPNGYKYKVMPRSSMFKRGYYVNMEGDSIHRSIHKPSFEEELKNEGDKYPVREQILLFENEEVTDEFIKEEFILEPGHNFITTEYTLYDGFPTDSYIRLESIGPNVLISGLIDADYRDNIILSAFNKTDDKLLIQKGIDYEVYIGQYRVNEDWTNLDNVRDGGFGSTDAVRSTQEN